MSAEEVDQSAPVISSTRSACSESAVCSKQHFRRAAAHVGLRAFLHSFRTLIDISFRRYVMSGDDM